MDSDEKYLDVREKLGKLEKVKASDDFVNKLHHKIVELEAEKRKMHAEKFDEGKGGFLRNLFANRQYPWLIPSAGFAVILFFVFYITFLYKNAPENNKEQSSTQKTEQAQDNSEVKTESNKANDNKETPVIPEQNKSTSQPENNQEKDIASGLKIEQRTEPLPQIETKKQKSDGDDSKSNIETFAQNENESLNSNKNLETESIENSGLIGIQKSAKESTLAKGTQEKNKAVEDETENNKLIDKLNSVEKTNLEDLRDKILNTKPE